MRKLYELGYEDNNVNKIWLMIKKKFQELAMKIYPGQSLKWKNYMII